MCILLLISVLLMDESWTVPEDKFEELMGIPTSEPDDDFIFTHTFGRPMDHRKNYSFTPTVHWYITTSPVTGEYKFTKPSTFTVPKVQTVEIVETTLIDDSIELSDLQFSKGYSLMDIWDANAQNEGYPVLGGFYQYYFTATPPRGAVGTPSTLTYRTTTRSSSTKRPSTKWVYPTKKLSLQTEFNTEPHDHYGYGDKRRQDASVQSNPIASLSTVDIKKFTNNKSAETLKLDALEELKKPDKEDNSQFNDTTIQLNHTTLTSAMDTKITTPTKSTQKVHNISKADILQEPKIHTYSVNNSRFNDTIIQMNHTTFIPALDTKITTTKKSTEILINISKLDTSLEAKTTSKDYSLFSEATARINHTTLFSRLRTHLIIGKKPTTVLRNLPTLDTIRNTKKRFSIFT